MGAIDDIIVDVLAEIKRQDDKWGIQDHSLLFWMSILMEEVGEACQCINRTIAMDGIGGFTPTRQEIVRMAAVCINMIASMDRQANPFRGD